LSFGRFRGRRKKKVEQLSHTQKKEERKTKKLFQVVAGWASAAARGILPGGLPRARAAVRSLLGGYDLAGAARAALAVDLASAGLRDEALALMAEDPAVRRSAAASGAATAAERRGARAAAGCWQGVVEAVLPSELQEDKPHPSLPPPKGSRLRSQLVELARLAAAAGAAAEARRLLEGAGEAVPAAALAAAAGDFVEGGTRPSSSSAAFETVAEGLHAAWERAVAASGAAPLLGADANIRFVVGAGNATDASAAPSSSFTSASLAPPNVACLPLAVPPAPGGVDAGGALPPLRGARAAAAVGPPPPPGSAAALEDEAGDGGRVGVGGGTAQSFDTEGSEAPSSAFATSAADSAVSGASVFSRAFRRRGSEAPSGELFF
jgi:hypothetical protein